MDTHARQAAQDEAEQASADHDDADDMQVDPQMASARQREPQDRPSGEEEDAQAGTQSSPPPDLAGRGWPGNSLTGVPSSRVAYRR